MDWEGGREGGVEDRRGSGSGGGLGAPHYIGGGGVVLLIVALIGYFVFHIDPRTILDDASVSDGQTQTEQQAPPADTSGDLSKPQDADGKFADIIHTSANDTWAAIFKAKGKPYHPSTIVLYTEDTQTACGDGQAAMGPFYCPQDEKVYIDLDFFNTLDQQLGAPGDAAKAYVIAHEVGHHIQKMLGVTDAVEAKGQNLDEAGANALSVKVELQADCYAGVWAKQSDQTKHWLDAGDIQGALNAAAAVGDDTLQKETQGRVMPDSFTHGTSAQRMHWFKEGYDTGKPELCDTFDASGA